MNYQSKNPYYLNNEEYDYLNSKTHLSMPHVFGPGRWDILHSYAKMCKTIEDKKQFANFVENIFAPTIKCLECRNHFNAMLMEYPVPFSSRLYKSNNVWTELDSSFKWSWMVHNIVNERLNKPQISFETCLKLYDIETQTCTQCYKPYN